MFNEYRPTQLFAKSIRDNNLDSGINYIERLNRENETATRRELNVQTRSTVSAKIAEALRPASVAPQGIQWQGKTLEFGKTYRIDGYELLIWNPTRLSDKQWGVIHNFIRSLTHGLNAPENLSPEKVAPWIDAIFAFNRGEMLESTFNKITKLNIKTSAFDSRNEHNL